MTNKKIYWEISILVGSFVKELNWIAGSETVGDFRQGKIKSHKWNLSETFWKQHIWTYLDLLVALFFIKMLISDRTDRTYEGLMNVAWYLAVQPSQWSVATLSGKRQQWCQPCGKCVCPMPHAKINTVKWFAYVQHDVHALDLYYVNPWAKCTHDEFDSPHTQHTESAKGWVLGLEKQYTSSPVWLKVVTWWHRWTDISNACWIPLKNWNAHNKSGINMDKHG